MINRRMAAATGAAGIAQDGNMGDEAKAWAIAAAKGGIAERFHRNPTRMPAMYAARTAAGIIALDISSSVERGAVGQGIAASGGLI